MHHSWSSRLPEPQYVHHMHTGDPTQWKISDMKCFDSSVLEVLKRVSFPAGDAQCFLKTRLNPNTGNTEMHKAHPETSTVFWTAEHVYIGTLHAFREHFNACMWHLMPLGSFSFKQPQVGPQQWELFCCVPAPCKHNICCWAQTCLSYMKIRAAGDVHK